MKLGILQCAAPGARGVDGHLAAQGLAALLQDHDLTQVWVDDAAAEMWLEKVRRLEAWILLGNDSERVRELSSQLRIPLIPVPIENAIVFADLRPLHHKAPRTVFCPPSSSAGKKTSETALSLYEALSKTNRALWLADNEAELEQGASPGNTSFFCPLFPALHGNAIASASRVISFRPVAALAAAVSGVPAVLVAPSEKNIEGIPHLDPQTPNLLKQQEALFENYPWKAVKETIAGLRKQTLASLKKGGIPTNAARPALRVAPTKGEEKLHVASISDSSYLPFLLGFIENVLAFEPPSKIVFYVAALDRHVGPVLRKQYPDANLVIWELKDLWAGPELDLIHKRSVGIQAYSSKPRLIERAVATAKAPVVYCDSDVHFFAPPRSLTQAIGKNAVLLFPHWNDVFSAARKDGLFNAGMLVAAPGAESFLEWWGSLCLENCAYSPESGIVCDQGYLDFAPVYFDRVQIYREGDHDVARWNLKSLSVKRPEGPLSRPLLGNGQPVASYHAAFVDSLGLFEVKFAWDQLVTFFSTLPAPDEIKPLFHNTVQQQHSHWGTLSRALFLQAKLGRALTPGRARFFTRGAGRWLIGGLAAMNRLTQRSRRPSGSDPDRFWIAALRSIIDPQTEEMNNASQARNNR